MTLDHRDKKRILDRYNMRLDVLGYDIQTLGDNLQSQAIRHEAAMKLLIRPGSILDVGCGFGDIIDHLPAGYAYEGCDLNPELVEYARIINPYVMFYHFDVTTEDFPATYDYIIACGVFNNRHQYSENWPVFQAAIGKMYAACRIGLHIDFLQSKHITTHRDIFYYDPHQVMSYCKSICPHIRNIDLNPLKEWALHLYKEAHNV